MVAFGHSFFLFFFLNLSAFDHFFGHGWPFLTFLGRIIFDQNGPKWDKGCQKAGFWKRGIDDNFYGLGVRQLDGFNHRIIFTSMTPGGVFLRAGRWAVGAPVLGRGVQRLSEGFSANIWRVWGGWVGQGCTTAPTKKDLIFVSVAGTLQEGS